MPGIGEVFREIPQKTVDTGVAIGTALGNTATGSAVPMARDTFWEAQAAALTHDLTKPGANGSPKSSRLYRIAEEEAIKIAERAEIYAAYTFSQMHQGDANAAFFDSHQPHIVEPITSPAQKYNGYSEQMLIREERLSREVEQFVLDKTNPKTHSTPREDTYDIQDGKTIGGPDNVKIELGDSPAASRADIWQRDAQVIPFEVREASDDVHLPREELLRRLEQVDPDDNKRTRREVIHDQFVQASGSLREAERLTQLEADAILAEYELDNKAKIRGGQRDQQRSFWKGLFSAGKTGAVLYGLPWLAHVVDIPIGLVDTLANFIEAVPADIANAPIPESWPAAHALKFVAAHLREIIIGTSLTLGAARVGMKRWTDSMQIKALAAKNEFLRDLVAEKVHARYAVVNG